MGSEVQAEVDRAVKAQARTCDERAKRFEKAVDEIGALKDLLINFTAETREHRKQVAESLEEHHHTLYGTDGDHQGLNGKVLVLEQDMGGIKRIMNRGIAAIVGMFVTGAGGWGTALWQWFKPGNSVQ